MPRIPLCLPKPGQNPVADEIRRRRHPRDLINLDGVLLNNPEIARGWNGLLGAVRSENSLPADLRELLILRVAAFNSAAYEWIQHENVGRGAGLTTLQLLRIRDVIKPIDHVQDLSKYSLSSLHLAGLAFADGMTQELRVTNQNLERFKTELGSHQANVGIDRMILDATATVAGYNMVSRVLFTLDVADDHHQSVPIPGLETETKRLTMNDGTELHTRIQQVVHPIEPRPWLVFCNSLLTNLTMWDLITPSLGLKYNLICFDQRGHGQSSVPSSPCQINQLADDVVEIVKQLNVSSPLHGLIGVSQGGATALAISANHPQLFKHIIACDTQAHSPPGNQEAWKKRIDLAQLTDQGPQLLSEATLARWFPLESHLNQAGNPARALVREMIEQTSIDGFKTGAQALYNYTIDEELIGVGDQNLLLLAGERDGTLPKALGDLSERLKQKDRVVEFKPIAGAGHLPMIDQPLRFLNAIESFLN